MRHKANVSSGSLTTEERAKNLQDAIAVIRKTRRWSQDEFAERANISRKALGRLLRSRGEVTTHDKTLQALEQFVATAERERGFVSRDMYLAIADGMGASTNNKEFIERFQDEYRVVRAHVPSRKALVSSLHIKGDPDNTVIR